MTSEVDFLIEVILYTAEFHTNFCKCLCCKISKLTQDKALGNVIIPYSMIKAANKYRWDRLETGRTAIKRRRTNEVSNDIKR